MNLTLSDISFRYAASPEPVFTGLDVTFPTGWTGIVGANGCGKSTLAKVAGGLLQPDCGSVVPRGLFCSYCAQEPAITPTDLLDFACDYSPKARELRTQLQIDDDFCMRFDCLSCGEQKKVQIACALAQQPDILILDEPTNHVDAACRQQLAAMLEGFCGIGLLISHDRELLDALASQCLTCEDGRWIMRPGGYTQTTTQGEKERKSAVEKRAQLRTEAKRLKQESQRRAAKAAQSDARRSRRKLDIHDSDGRAKVGLAIFSGQDGKAASLASNMRERADKAQAAADAAFVTKRYEGELWLDATPAARKMLVRIPEAALPCGPERVLHVPELFINNSSHIGITGANGSGKTTLVRHLMGLVPDDVPMLYIPQELGQQRTRTLTAELAALEPTARGQVLSTVTQLGTGARTLLDSDLLSPGTARKLLLVMGLKDAPALIVMDEPTNHMDLPSIEALQRALAACPVALVLVSHDTLLLEACCSELWDVEGWHN